MFSNRTCNANELGYESDLSTPSRLSSRPQGSRGFQNPLEAGAFDRGSKMELEGTESRTRNEGPRLKAVPYANGHYQPSLSSLRTDDELIQAARSGDHDSFAELCRRHSRTANRKILSIVRHREDAEDAMQETLLRAYTNLGRFRQSCKFSTWITAIAINAALGALRKRKSQRESGVERWNLDESDWSIADLAPGPEVRVAKAQIIVLLRKELRDLPSKMQEAVVAYYGNDCSLQEAAEALGISVAAAKSRLVRGRRNLRSSLERKGLLDSDV
jgi:RNA polymerase sigma-70 factor, ECF subfamily